MINSQFRNNFAMLRAMMLLNLLVLFTLGASQVFDDDTYRIYISSTKGKITRKKLTTKKNVGHLDISFSEVESIEPDSFCAVPNLKTLYMNGNDKFPKLTKELFQCTPKLLHVTLDASIKANQELERNAFTDLKELSFLRINDLNIGRVGKDMFVGVNLEILNLVSCKISEIDSDAFSLMPKLKELHLGHNIIKNFKQGTFKNLPNLRELMLNKNDISELNWEQWDPVSSLRAIDFGDNPLVLCDVSKVKEYFPSIRSFNLGDSFNASQKAAIIEESKRLNITFRFTNYY